MYVYDFEWSLDDVCVQLGECSHCAYSCAATPLMTLLLRVLFKMLFYETLNVNAPSSDYVHLAATVRPAASGLLWLPVSYASINNDDFFVGDPYLRSHCMHYGLSGTPALLRILTSSFPLCLLRIQNRPTTTCEFSEERQT